MGISNDHPFVHRPRPRTMWVLLPRLGRLVAVALVGTTILPVPASADPARPTNYRSRVLTITPALPDGTSLRVLGGDAFLELGVPIGTRAEVPDYDQGSGTDPEVYLRFAADGTVTRNQLATAATLNESRYGTSPEPADTSPPTEWKTVATKGRYAWHDHRIHWMLPSAPPNVDKDGRVQLDGPDGTWEVPIVVDGTTHVVRGELLLLSSPASLVWWTTAVIAAIVAMVVGALGRTGRQAVAVLLGIVSLGASLTAWATWNASPPSTGPSTIPIGIAVLGTVAAAVAAITGLASRRLIALAAAAASVGAWAWLRRAVFDHAVLPTTLPADLDRLVTATTLGVATGVAAGLIWRPPRSNRPDGTGG